jgi:hypothetical protein
VNRNQFDFALERLGSGDWKKFEDIASTFMASEFPNLRTMASPSGDRGRDAELYTSTEDPSVVFQYSVASDWNAKIRRTAKTISENFDD